MELGLRVEVAEAAEQGTQYLREIADQLETYQDWAGQQHSWRGQGWEAEQHLQPNSVRVLVREAEQLLEPQGLQA